MIIESRLGWFWLGLVSPVGADIDDETEVPVDTVQGKPNALYRGIPRHSNI